MDVTLEKMVGIFYNIKLVLILYSDSCFIRIYIRAKYFQSDEVWGINILPLIMGESSLKPARITKS